MKYNPFQPNKIVSSGMFVGRIDELKTIEQCLFQAKNGNPHHFLIQGERGIGKSSLLWYVEHVASGVITALDDTPMKFLTVSIDLNGCKTQLDLVRAVGRGLRQSLSKHQTIKDRAAAFYDWVTNWEILGVRLHKDTQEPDPEDLADELVTRIATLMEDLKGHREGLFLLIDEADQPDIDAGLGQFAKLFTERLTRSRADTVLVGMAGLPSLIAKLRASHESSPRIFQTLLLEPLEIEERKRVVEAGLKEAAKKNDSKTDITPSALKLIADLSEGYPHFVQQFAHSAFDRDTDDNITDEDVLSGAYGENGAISQLGHKYFDEMYYGKVGSNDYRKVLDEMAEHSDEWVQKSELVKAVDIKASTLANAIKALKARKIILADEGRQGFYRLPTKSFAAWINAIKSVEDKKDGEPLL